MTLVISMNKLIYYRYNLYHINSLYETGALKAVYLY